MITRITLQQFKSFQELDLSLSPITVLAGANSSGKSSVIQSLLLLRQTLQGLRARPLAISGDLINFTNFTEIVFEKQSAERLRIGLDIVVEKLPDTVTDDLLSTVYSPAEINVIRSGMPQMSVHYLLTFAQG